MVDGGGNSGGGVEKKKLQLTLVGFHLITWYSPDALAIFANSTSSVHRPILSYVAVSMLL